MTDVLRLGGVERDRLVTAPFVALPLGSVEYHGPHAPLGTDTTLAVGFAGRIAEAFGALQLPPIAYAFAPGITSGERGTLSLAPEVYLAYLTEVLLAIARSGATRILALNGHSENQYALRLAAERLALEVPETSLLAVNWWKLVDRSPDGFSEHGGHGHGGPLEISTTAAFDPMGVAPELAENIPYRPLWWRQAAQIVGRGQAPDGFAGYHGRVDEIDAARGNEVVDRVMVALERLVRDWLERADAASD
jgi:creatinine amidohydrolase